MRINQQPESHTRGKIKTELGLSNYATRKELYYAAGVDTSDLAAKNALLLWKLKLTKYTLLNQLMFKLIWIIQKQKVDHLDVGKPKTVRVNLNKLSDVVDSEVVKNTKCKTLKTNIINVGKKIPDATALIHINQYNIDKQNLEK